MSRYAKTHFDRRYVGKLSENLAQVRNAALYDDPLELTAPLDPPIDWVWLTEED